MKQNTYSLTSAKNTLKLFFEKQEVMTPEDVFKLPERVDKTEANNVSYLYNKLTLLRHFNLITTHKVVGEDGVSRIGKITLTQAGKELLRSTSETEKLSGSNPALQSVTLQSITEAVEEFNRLNPSWEFELVPKRVKKKSQLPPLM